MSFPILYRRSASKNMLMWGIEVEGATILTHHGRVGGAIQSSSDTIREGKNLGRSNATTPEEQARAEAEARFTKQKKRGYVETEAAALAGAVGAEIEGGIEPMLAPNKSYPKDPNLSKAIVFPAYFQPKLDGMRCVAIVEDGIATLWSRTRKPIRSVPHIVEALERQFPTGRVVLDGELYNHEFRAEFEELISLLRGDEPDDEGRYLQAQYHLYDCLEAEGVSLSAPFKVSISSPFMDRNVVLDRLLYGADIVDGPIRRVDTYLVDGWEELITRYEAALLLEYEGGMARNALAPYESGKRSKHLQKMKEFETDEFAIIGASDGKGKDSGTVATFTCVTKDGKEFYPRPKMTYARRKELWERPEQWKGKKATVRFKRYTAYGIPYIPQVLAIRDYE